MSSYPLLSFQSNSIHRGTVYEPFSSHTPSDITIQTITPCSSPAHRHNSPVVFDEEGWTASTDTGQSGLDTPSMPVQGITPLVLFAVVYAIYVIIKRKRAVRSALLAALFLCLLPLPCLADISLLFSMPGGHSGDSIAVTPTLSDIPDGTPHLCWNLYYDAACTHEVSGTRFFVARGGAANTVYFTAPPTGTYYLQTTLRIKRKCDAEIVEQIATPFAVYPSDADIVLVRHQQEGGQRVNLRADMPAEKKLYGVMTFDKNTVNDDGLSDYERYNYFLSLPFDVRVGDIYGFGTYGRHWLIEYYDGLSRAQNGYWADSEPNWKRITDTDSVLHAHQGYMLKLNANRMTADQTDVWANDADVATLYFPALSMTDAITTQNETIPALSEAYQCTIDYSATLGDEADRRIKDSYWRCIGVPSMAEWEGSLFPWRTDDVPYLYEWDMSDNSLNVVSGISFTFEAMHAYMVQNGAPIIWYSVSVPHAGISARNRSTEEHEYELVLLQDSIVSDRTFIRLSDRQEVTTDFDFCYDLSKEFNPGSNLYTLIGHERAAANCLPFSGDSLIIPVGVQATSSGDYTLSLRRYPQDLSVVLRDNVTGQRTVLTQNDYTLHLDAGSYDHRFALVISTPTESPTGWTNHPSGNEVQKRWHNGRLYIYRAGKLYDATGRCVRSE